MPNKYDSVLVLSDSHVGLPDKEIFRKDFESFIKFLTSHQIIQVDSKEEGFQFNFPSAIVLLGDFVDLWDGSLSKLTTFLAICARGLTASADVLYMRGNHDYIVPNLESTYPQMKNLRISEEEVLEVAGKQFFFIHGHQFISMFGPISLKLESFINPFYSMMENFLSRLSRGHGKLWLNLLTLFTFCVGLSFWLTPVNELSIQLTQLRWMVLGFLLPIAIVNVWRVGQKRLWKFITMIFGELISSVRGAAKGDTIEYLTSNKKPISNWFKKESAQSKQARKAGFVVFGHTHLPEGPMSGTSDSLREVTFLNTGSWMRPPDKSKLAMANRARMYTRFIDPFDEYIVLLLLALTVVTLFTRIIPIIPILLLDVVVVLLEILIVLGKSSYGRLPLAGVRSIAFIGKDVNGAFRSVLLYWHPVKKTLTTRQQTN